MSLLIKKKIKYLLLAGLNLCGLCCHFYFAETFFYDAIIAYDKGNEIGYFEVTH
jgi:hypothetical protein